MTEAEYCNGVLNGGSLAFKGSLPSIDWLSVSHDALLYGRCLAPKFYTLINFIFFCFPYASEINL